jgi:hypothetical protein
VAGADAVLPGQCAEQGVPQLPAEQHCTAVEGELGLLWGQPQDGSPPALMDLHSSPSGHPSWAVCSSHLALLELAEHREEQVQ